MECGVIEMNAGESNRNGQKLLRDSEVINIPFQDRL
jgi:hypothetical protein